MDESKRTALDRRSFLTGAATGAAVMLAKQTSVAAAQETGPTGAATASEPNVTASDATRPASDFMVDIFKSLGLEYMFSM
jgi:secreted PhoX family phosphatase